MEAGELRFQFRFERRKAANDGFGNTEGDWEAPFDWVWGKRVFLRGSESVIAARMTGRSPALLQCRASSEMEMVDTSWRCIDITSGETFNILSVTPDQKNMQIDFMIEAGGADG